MLLIFLGELGMVGIGYYFSDKVKTTLEETFGRKMIENYRENDDFGNIIDLTQEYFECCGMSNDGFRYFECIHFEQFFHTINFMKLRIL